MESKNTISLDQIQSLAVSLKELNDNWAKDLSELIMKNKKHGERVDSTKIYNILNSHVKNQKFRRMFVLFGVDLLDKYRADAQKAIVRLNSVEQ